jgi:uncharacterized protein (DUF305 family)
MNNKLLLTSLIALVIGAGGGYLISNSSDKSNETSDENMMHSAMDDMMSGLDGKTGDAFDKVFLAEMIVHHEGAVDMAEAALQNAKHVEIKTMANVIISAQTSEIQQMKEWQKSWYGAN